MDYENDDKILAAFVEETNDHLAAIESRLLTLEQGGGKIDDEVVHGMFRDAHTIKAGANLLELKHIEELANRLENILHQFRSRQLVPDEDIISVVLNGVDKLRELTADIRQSDRMDISSQIEKLLQVTQKE